MPPLVYMPPAGVPRPELEVPLPYPKHESGGGIPSLGAVFSETFTDLTENIGGYCMAGLAFVAVVFPVSMVGTLVGMFTLYLVMGLGVVASAAGGSAIGEATGDQDLGGVITAFGGLGSFVLGFIAFFLIVAVMVGVLAPVTASLYRAIAEHQRGGAPLTFGGAFATVGQDVGSTVGAACLLTLASMVGMLFCYVGALVPLVLFCFAFLMVALHRKGALNAMKICAAHAIARPAEHVLFCLAYFATAFIAGNIPVLGHIFMVALSVRAYRKMFGDAAEPVL